MNRLEPGTLLTVLGASVLGLTLGVSGCRSSAPAAEREPAPGAAASPLPLTPIPNSSAFVLSSPDFHEGDPLPARLTCDGADQAPALVWKGAPASVRSYALIAMDPDAPGGDFTHWVLFDIPGSATVLSGATAATAIAGKNDFGKIGYGGPCPPEGEHHYIFTLYALGVSGLPLSRGASRSAVEKSMKGHVLARSRLTGMYRRR